MKLSPWLALAAPLLLTQPALAAVKTGGWEVLSTTDGITVSLYQESGQVDVTYLSLGVSTLGSGASASRTLTGSSFTLGNAGLNPWTGLGWARVRFEDNGQLTLLDSAMGYRVDTLVVGAVPEPAGAWQALEVLV